MELAAIDVDGMSLSLKVFFFGESVVIGIVSYISEAV